jgi:hypothetical protein
MPDDHAFVYPKRSGLGRLVEVLANSVELKQARRVIFRRLPFPVLESDIVDVVYLNWLVDLARIKHLVPAGIEVSNWNGRTVLSILTYRHGSFGPAAAGPLRRLLPSPLQSNWRLYVQSVNGQPLVQPTVLFLKNVIDHPVYALGARVMSDVLPADLPRSMRLARRGDRYLVNISPGRSYAPDLHLELHERDSEASGAEFTEAFGELAAAARWIFEQEAAIAPVPDVARLAYGEISIPIDPDLVVPLSADMGTFRSRFLSPLVGSVAPFCFVVKRVHFRVVSERLLD